MKKVILIISAMILILLFNTNVKASTIGDHWVGNVKDSNNNNLPFNALQGYIYAYESLNTFTNYNRSVSIENQFNHKHGDIYIYGYLYNTGISSDTYLDCRSTTGQYNACESWGDSNYSQIDFQLWIGSFTNQCKIDMNTNKYSDQPQYIYWTATCKQSGNTFSQILYSVKVNNQDGTQQTYQVGFNRNIQYEIDSNQQIVEQQQQTNEILNETTQYNTETNTNTIGANETMQAGQMEDQLIQQNEFNGSIMDGMAIDSSASGFIWQIMEKLRGMNIAIVTLMTMALGLGVIKLVLNR